MFAHAGLRDRVVFSVCRARVAKQQAAFRGQRGQPGLHQAPVVFGVEAVHAQQGRVVANAAARQQTLQGDAAGVGDQEPLHIEARAERPRRAAHRRRRGHAAQGVQQHIANAGQVVHMLVAVDVVGCLAGTVAEGGELGVEFGADGGLRQAPQMGLCNQAWQRRKLRPHAPQFGTQRRAFGQVEVQAALHAGRQRAQQWCLAVPMRAVGQARGGR